MKEVLQKYLTVIDRLGGDSRQLIYEEPASESDLLEVERIIEKSIPGDFRKDLSTHSSSCEFKWFLPDNFTLPYDLRQIFCGDLVWNLDTIVRRNKNYDATIRESFPNREDECDKVWYEKFLLQEVGNGDYISIDLASFSYGKIVYISHECDEENGYVMANSFTELLSNWTRLGCVGAEAWQWLPFYDDEIGINPESDNAKLWLKTIGWT